MRSQFKWRNSVFHTIFVKEICSQSGNNHDIKETEDLRDRWVKAINTIMEHLKKMNKNKKNIEKTEESWRWKNNIDKEKSETIRMENEQVILQEGDHEK